jgi:3-oxoadipate enol-lactonase
MLVRIGGNRIHYDLTGPESGPVVCFTHSLASDGGMWAEQMEPLLEAGFRVLRIDMRGHGGTPAVAGDYTMEGLADDVAGVLDGLGIGPVHFVGLSIGGMIGQGFAIRHGGKVKSLMLCDTLPASLPGAREVWGPRIETVRKANSLAPIADGTMDRWFTPAFKPRKPRRWQELRDTVAETTPEGFIGCAAAICSFDWVPKLPSIKAPTLVVCGTGDEGTPPAEGRRLAGLIPGGRFEEIADAKHFPNVEQDAAFNRILLGWLKDQR